MILKRRGMRYNNFKRWRDEELIIAETSNLFEWIIQNIRRISELDTVVLYAYNEAKSYQAFHASGISKNDFINLNSATLEYLNALEDYPDYFELELILNEQFEGGKVKIVPLFNEMAKYIGLLITHSHKPDKELSFSREVIGLLDMITVKLDGYLQHNKQKKGGRDLEFLADNSPGAIFELEVNTQDTTCSVNFLSAGWDKFGLQYKRDDIIRNPSLFLNLIDSEDYERVKINSLRALRDTEPLNMEYKLKRKRRGKEKWHWLIAKVYRVNSKSVFWYGSIQDISLKKEYMNTVEKMLFDISHVVRRPVASMMGLINLIETEDLSQAELMHYLELVKKVSLEMDDYTKNLIKAYTNLNSSFEKKSKDI